MLVINVRKHYVFIAGFNQLCPEHTQVYKEWFKTKQNRSQLRKAHLLHSYILFQIIMVYFPPSHQFFPTLRFPHPPLSYLVHFLYICA